MISSALLSMICFFFGITASYGLDTPAGASVVIANLIAFCIFWLIGLIPRRERK
jgi:zinc transport system permease protein